MRSSTICSVCIISSIYTVVIQHIAPWWHVSISAISQNPWCIWNTNTRILKTKRYFGKIYRISFLHNFRTKIFCSNTNYDIVFITGRGRAMAQVVSHRPLTAKVRVPDRSIHVGFVVDKVALGQVSLRVLRFYPVSIIPPSLSKLISPGGCTICPLVAAVQRRLTPSKSIDQQQLAESHEHAQLKRENRVFQHCRLADTSLASDAKNFSWKSQWVDCVHRRRQCNIKMFGKDEKKGTMFSRKWLNINKEVAYRRTTSFLVL
jgi:hypothetical protein